MSMKKSDFRCLDRMRVRWAEVDLQKIVFNAHYLMYLDTAIAAYWRGLAAAYETALHGLGGDLYVKKSSLEYFASARYDDQIDVGLRCARIGNSSLTFLGGIFRGEDLLVSGELIYVFADPATQTSRPVPAPLRALYESFEAGAPMTELVLGGWDAVSDGASALRRAVFVQEQGIGEQLVWDEKDATAVHAVLKNRLGHTVASGRLVQEAPGVGRIGRMAVERVLRGCDLGQRVLIALVDAARARGDREVMLHAQASAKGFYLREGFALRGAAFEEAGIEHQEMVLKL